MRNSVFHSQIPNGSTWYQDTTKLDLRLSFTYPFDKRRVDESTTYN